MATLFERIKTLVSANLHALVDQAIQANSPAVLKQYRRDTLDLMERARTEIANLTGLVAGLQRQYDQLQGDVSELDARVNTLIEAKRDDLAKRVLRDLKAKRASAETMAPQLDQMNEQLGQLNTYRDRLEARLQDIDLQIEDMERLLALAKAKERMTGVARSLRDLMDDGDPDVSGVAQSIQARLDKADAALDLEMQDGQQQQIEDVLADQELADEIAARKQAMSNAG